MQMQYTAGGCDTEVHKKDTRSVIFDWLEVLGEQIYPSEQQLEYMLDRIEGTP